MDDLKELYALPLEIIVSLVAGYLGYKLFSVGKNDHHKNHDVLFQIFVFSVPAYVLMGGLASESWTQLIGLIVLSVIVILVLAIFIRAILPWLLLLPKWLRLSNDNLQPNTWMAIQQDTVNDVKLIDVLTEDGEWITSELGKVPLGVPHYPANLDIYGNIGMYVTSKIDIAGKETLYVDEDIFSEEWGATLTYIPASSIKRIQITKLKK